MGKRSSVTLLAALVVAVSGCGQGERRPPADPSTPSPTTTERTFTERPTPFTTAAPGEGESFRIGCEPTDVILAAGSLWVACVAEPLLRIDRTTGRVVAKVELGEADSRIPGSGHAIAYRAGRIYLANPVGTDDDPRPPHSFSGGYGMIDASTNEVVGARVFSDRAPVGVTTGESSVWFSTGDTVLQVDPYTLAISKVIQIDGIVASLSGRGRDLWVAVNEEDGSGQLLRIVDRTGEVAARIELPGTPQDVHASENFVWVLLEQGHRLLRIDPGANAIEGSTAMPSPVWSIATGGGSVWVSDYRGGVIRRLDPGTLRIVDEINPGPWPAQFVVDGDTLWATNYVAQELRRIRL